MSLVDTDGRGVDRVTEKGVWANGQEHELDAIIFATGFDAVIGKAILRSPVPILA